MKKILKRIIKICIALFLVAFCAVWLLRFVVPQRTLNTFATHKLEALLHRDVVVSDVALSFSGIQLADVVVSEKDGTTPFLSAKKIKISFQLRSLLTKQWMINKLVFNEPSIRIVRSVDGTTNMSDMFAGEQGGVASSLPLVLTDVIIRNGTLVYEDSKTPMYSCDARALTMYISRSNWSSVIRTKIRGTVHQQHSVLTSEIVTADVQIKAELDTQKQMLSIGACTITANSASLAAHGTVDTNNGTFDLRIIGKNVGTHAITRRVLNKKILDALYTSGSVSLDCIAHGTLDAMTLKGTSDMTEAYISYKDYVAKPSGMPAALDYTVALQKKHIAINTLVATWNDVCVTIKGDVVLDERTALSVSVRNADCAKAAAFLPRLKKYETRGTITGDLRYASTSPKKITATIVCNDVHAASKGLVYDNITGTIAWDATMCSDKIKGLINGAPFSFDLEIRDMRTNKNPTGTFTVSVQSLNLDEVFAANRKTAPSSSRSSRRVHNTAAPAFFPLPFSLNNVTLEGIVKADSLIYRNIEGTGVLANCMWKDKILRINPLTFHIGNGVCTGKASIAMIRMDDIDYLIDVTLTDCPLEQLLARMENIQGKLHGTATGEVKLRGHGKAFAAMYSRGTLDVTQGKCVGFPFIEGLGTALQIPSFTAIEYRTASVVYEIKDGSIAIKKGTVESTVGDFSCDGTINVPKKELDLTLRLRLTKELSNGLLAAIMKDAEGRITHVVTMEGPMNRPSYTYIIAEKVQNDIIQQGLNLLQQATK